MIAEEGHSPAKWIKELKDSGASSFYSVKDGATYFYDIPQKTMAKVPGQDAFIILDNIGETKSHTDFRILTGTSKIEQLILLNEKINSSKFTCSSRKYI